VIRLIVAHVACSNIAQEQARHWALMADCGVVVIWFGIAVDQAEADRWLRMEAAPWDGACLPVRKKETLFGVVLMDFIWILIVDIFDFLCKVWLFIIFKIFKIICYISNFFSDKIKYIICLKIF
jgi:hypothetical protein